MEYFRGFRTLSEDPRWVHKVLMASLVLFVASLIPFAGNILMQFLLVGWQARLLRNFVREGQGLVREGQSAPSSGPAASREIVPLEFNMEQLGAFLRDGLKGFVAAMVWTLPGILLLLLVTIPAMFALVALENEVAPELADTLLAVLLIIGGAFLFVAIIALQVPGYVALMRAELSEDLHQALSPRGVWRMSRAVGGRLFTALVVVGLVSLPLTFAGLLLCCVGIYPVIVVLGWVQADIYAQVYQLFVDEGGEPLTLARDGAPTADQVAEVFR